SGRRQSVPVIRNASSGSTIAPSAGGPDRRRRGVRRAAGTQLARDAAPKTGQAGSRRRRSCVAGGSAGGAASAVGEDGDGVRERVGGGFVKLVGGNDAPGERCRVGIGGEPVIRAA